MRISQAEGKRVKITCVDGEVITGFAYDYISESDNEPEPASITIDHIEIYENEIEKIELIK